MQLTNLQKIILDTLFPQFCLNCQKEGDLFCQDCLSLIDITPFQYCPFCQKPERVQKPRLCKKHSGKYYLNGLFFATPYKNQLCRKMILSFKYEPYLKTLAKPLAFLIISHFLLSEKQAIFQPGENSIIIPVPLFKSKKRKRGFNQSELLSQELADFFNIPTDFDNLVKIKKTAQQAGLKKEEREKNLIGCFALKNPQAIKDKKIFLVDDVFTTGTTLEECSRVLKKYKASKVYGIAVAREALE